jgi:hypothetical protein
MCTRMCVPGVYLFFGGGENVSLSPSGDVSGTNRELDKNLQGVMTQRPKNVQGP